MSVATRWPQVVEGFGASGGVSIYVDPASCRVLLSVLDPYVCALEPAQLQALRGVLAAAQSDVDALRAERVRALGIVRDLSKVLGTKGTREFLEKALAAELAR